jgi:hypothetical protein
MGEKRREKIGTYVWEEKENIMCGWEGVNGCSVCVHVGSYREGASERGKQGVCGGVEGGGGWGIYGKD